MKKLNLLLVLMFTVVAVAQAEEVYSKRVKRAAADAVEAYSEDWEKDENWGSVWVASYSGEYSQPESWSFYIDRKEDRNNDGRTDWMHLNVEFACGSEYDESEFPGACLVEVEKKGRKWVAAEPTDCECGF